jgi:ferrous iron transport protein A
VKGTISLSELHPGETGTVVALSIPGSVGKRLLELGLRPGTEVTCLQRAPAGDPTAYGFKGVVVALRNREARAIRMEGQKG